MNSIVKTHLLPSLLALLSMLTACGGGGGSGGGVSTPPPPPPPAANFTLTVTPPTNGTVSANSGGIACGATCSASYASGTVVTLTATPAASFTFNGWSGACSGSSSTCTVTLSQARSVSATFTASSPATGTAALSWTAPTQDTDGNAITDLTGYRIYYGTNPSSLTQTVTISSGSTLNHTFTGLAAGTWYFAMTSVTGTGASAVESDRTGTVSKVIP